MNIIKLLESGDVERFHQCTGMTKQKLSEHQWGVALLIQKFFPDCHKHVILAALTHDSAELVTGDIPATTKWSVPEIRSLLEKMEQEVELEWGVDFALSKYEKYMLKSCDMIEGMRYCLKRTTCGELRASIPFYAWYNHICEYEMIDNVYQLDMIENMRKEMEKLVGDKYVG